MRATRSAASLLVGGGNGGGSRPSSRSGPEVGLRKGNFSLDSTSALQRSNSCAQLFNGPSGFNGLTKLEFGHARGETGLTFEGLVVGYVSGQARKLGVQPGWKIHTVDGYMVRSDEEVFLRLQEAKWQWRSCCVWFATDKAAIRAEQTRARAATIQAEVERLAKLPFDGHQDSRHLNQVVEEFSYQGHIEHVEDRAVTLPQLRRINDFSATRCHRWRDAGPREVSKTAGQKLTMNLMNLHHINHWIVKPATQIKACSFVELLTAQRQPADWFVIHWWGERVTDFLRCIEAHAETRKLPDTTGYWVSAYATRQHAHAPVQTLDHPSVEFSGAAHEGAHTSFGDGMGGIHHRVLAATKFNALLTLDTATTAFTRLWCDIEAHLLAQQSETQTTLDIVINQNPKPAMITKGLTSEEQDLEKDVPGSGCKAKLDREKSFDLDIIFNALSLQVQTAQCSDAADRRSILNSIADRELSQPPPEQHPSYDKMNKRLHALFALTCWSRVMGGGDADGQSQAKMSSALRSDVDRKSLHLSLAFCSSFEEKVVALVRSLPPNLRSLRLDLKGTNIADDKLWSLAQALPAGLEQMELDLSHNSHITTFGVISFTEKLPKRMISQNLKLNGTNVSKELLGCCDTLAGVQQYIQEEASKGTLCTITSLVPCREPTKKGGGMEYTVTRCIC